MVTSELSCKGLRRYGGQIARVCQTCNSGNHSAITGSSCCGKLPNLRQSRQEPHSLTENTFKFPGRPPRCNSGASERPVRRTLGIFRLFRGNIIKFSSAERDRFGPCVFAQGRLANWRALAAHLTMGLTKVMPCQFTMLLTLAKYHHRCRYRRVGTK